jgi:hypothetical protein
MASAVPELVPPISMSRPCVSNHSRALAAAMSVQVGEQHHFAVDRAAQVGDFLDPHAPTVDARPGYVGDQADLDHVAETCLGAGGSVARPQAAGSS